MLKVATLWDHFLGPLFWATLYESGHILVRVVNGGGGFLAPSFVHCLKILKVVKNAKWLNWQKNGYFWHF